MDPGAVKILAASSSFQLKRGTSVLLGGGTVNKTASSCTTGAAVSNFFVMVPRPGAAGVYIQLRLRHYLSTAFATVFLVQDVMR